MRAVRRLEYRRRGKTSWLIETWPDGRRVERISKRAFAPEEDGKVRVLVVDRARVRLLSGDEAERAWAAR